MLQADRKALADCLRRYRRRGPRQRAEIASLTKRHGWQCTAYHACIKEQAAALDLPWFRLVPAELEPTSPRFGADASYDRGPQIEIVRKLDELGLSRFVPDPKAAIVLALQMQRWGISPASDAA